MAFIARYRSLFIITLLFLLLAVGTVFAINALQQTPISNSNQDAAVVGQCPNAGRVNVIHSVEVDRNIGQLGHQNFSCTEIPSENMLFEVVPMVDKKIETIGARRLPRSISKSQALCSRQIVDVIIRRNENLKIPRFPSLPYGIKRESKIGLDVKLERQSIIRDLQKKRETSKKEFIEQLNKGALETLNIHQTFWIIDAFWASIEDCFLSKLIDHPLVIQNMYSIEIVNRMNGVPSQMQADSETTELKFDNDDSNDPKAAAGIINLKPYSKSEFTKGYIAVIDSGVFVEHALLSNHLDYLVRYDCVNGNNICQRFFDDQQTYPFSRDDCQNHGTRTISILRANSPENPQFNGMTRSKIDVYRTFGILPSNETGREKSNLRCNKADKVAILRAIQAALENFASIIVYEVDLKDEDETGLIATAADNAYDAGAINIAANGNSNKPSAEVASPAIAHKVIGVSAYGITGESVLSGATEKIRSNSTAKALGTSTVGPATDGRFKPDILLPTQTDTASSKDPHLVDSFKGTSGATPYAAASAFLLNNWLKQFGEFDNGQIYVKLFEQAQFGHSSFDADDAFDSVRQSCSTPSTLCDKYIDNPDPNVDGMGALRLVDCAKFWWGKVELGDSTANIVDIPLNIPEQFGVELVGALWWPESSDLKVTNNNLPLHQQPSVSHHNDIDLELIPHCSDENENCPSAFESNFKLSVFERIEIDLSAIPFTTNWTFRIKGTHIQNSPQTVYWAAHAKSCSNNPNTSP